MSESGPSYLSTASVFGQLNAQVDRLDETGELITVSNNTVRLVTTELSGPRRLAILEDATGLLKSVGPSGGKVFAGVGDRITGVSYIGRNAYVRYFTDDSGSETKIFDLTGRDFKVQEWNNPADGNKYPLGADYMLVLGSAAELYDV